MRVGAPEDWVVKVSDPVTKQETYRGGMMARTLEELEEDAELLEDRLYEDLAERTDLFYVIDGKYYRFELHVTVVEITDEEELQILRN